MSSTGKKKEYGNIHTFFLIEKEIFNLKLYIIYSLPYIDLRFCNPTIGNSKRDDAKQIPRILPIHRDTFLFPFPPDVEAATRVSITGGLTRLPPSTELVLCHVGAQLSAAVRVLPHRDLSSDYQEPV